MSNRIWWKEWQAGSVTMGLEIWDSDTSSLVDPTMIELPAESTFEFGNLKFEYEKRRALGSQKTPVLTVRVNLSELTQTAELQDLATRILSPRGVDPSAFVFSTETRDFYTTTTWRLYYIDSTDTRHNLFTGAQRVAGSLMGSTVNVATPAAGTTTTITLYHLAQIALMEVKPDDVSRDMHLKGAFGPKGLLYEQLWLDGGAVYGVTVATPGTPYPNTKLQAYSELWDSVQDLANQVYQAHMRTSSLDFQFTSPLRDGGSDPWATPLDHWTLFKQNYLRDGLAGTELDVDDALLPTFVTRSDKTFARDPETGCHAGTLIDQGQGPDRDPSLYRFRTMWDMVSVEALWRRCKVQLREETWGLNLRFQKLYSSSWSTAPDEPHARTVAQLMNTTVNWEKGADAISGAKVSIPGLQGDDIADVSTLTPLGNAAEEEMTVRALFHNTLSLRSKSDAYQRILGADPKDPSPDIDHAHALIGLYGDPSPFELYYWEQPNVSGTDLTNVAVPVRIHSQVGIDDGLPINLIEGGVDVDWPSYVTAGSDWKLWWQAMRPRMFVEQRQGGMGRAICESMPLSFAQPANVRWDKLVLELEDLPPWMMGEYIALGAGTGNDLLDGIDTYLSSVRCDYAAIVDWDLNTDTGQVTFTCFFLDDY